MCARVFLTLIKWGVFTSSANHFTRSSAFYMYVKHHERVKMLGYVDLLPLPEKAFKKTLMCAVIKQSMSENGIYQLVAQHLSQRMILGDMMISRIHQMGDSPHNLGKTEAAC